MLGCGRIRILAVFCSSKVMAKWKNCRVFLFGYTCYENHQSSCRVDSSFLHNVATLEIPLQWEGGHMMHEQKLLAVGMLIWATIVF
jgi:hypothetical protein